MFKKLIYFLPAVLIALILSSCNVFERAYYKAVLEFEARFMQKHDNISSVKVLHDIEGVLWYSKMSVLFTFNDGQYLHLYIFWKDLYKNYAERKPKVSITTINGYSFHRYKGKLYDEIVTRDFSSSIDMIVEEEGLSTIDEIIENFEIMSVYMDTLPILTSEMHRCLNREWFWKDEFYSRRKTIDGYEIIDLKRDFYNVEGPPREYGPYREEKDKWRSRLRM